MSFVLTLSVVSLVVGLLYVQASSKQRRLSSTSWVELVERLEEVPMTGIRKIALDYLEPTKGQLSIETDEMWQLIGGEQGLQRMKANADILIQLAAFAEQWNRDESIVVGERMRREGVALRRAVGKIQRSLWFGYGKATSPFFVQEAASTYFLMRQRILALYETSHAGRYGRLSIALGDMMAAYGPAI